MKTKLKHILRDHGHEFIKSYGTKVSPYAISVLISVMNCCTTRNGYRSFFCVHCKIIKRIAFTCKKWLCPTCSVWSNRRFAINFVQRMLPVTHRHLMMSIPEVLWEIYHDDKHLQKLLIKASYETVRQMMVMYLHVDVMPGAMCVLHNFGRDLKKNCHIHMIVTEGGMFEGIWHRFTYFPFEKKGRVHTTINELWRDNVLELLRLSLPRTSSNERFLTGIRNRYPNGFYVYGPSGCRIKSNRKAYKKAKYITRYVRHPPISDSRISDYDGERVTIWYDHPSSGRREYVTFSVLEFIYCVIIHLPDKGMHVVVNYGLYSPRYVQKVVIQSIFDTTGEVIDPRHLSWRSSLILNTGIDPLCCPFCRREMLEVYLVYKCSNGLQPKCRLLQDDLSAIDYPSEEKYITSLS